MAQRSSGNKLFWGFLGLDPEDNNASFNPFHHANTGKGVFDSIRHVFQGEDKQEKDNREWLARAKSWLVPIKHKFGIFDYLISIPIKLISFLINIAVAISLLVASLAIILADLIIALVAAPFIVGFSSSLAYLRLLPDSMLNDNVKQMPPPSLARKIGFGILAAVCGIIALPLILAIFATFVPLTVVALALFMPSLLAHHVIIPALSIFTAALLTPIVAPIVWVGNKIGNLFSSSKKQDGQFNDDGFVSTNSKTNNYFNNNPTSNLYTNNHNYNDDADRYPTQIGKYGTDLINNQDKINDDKTPTHRRTNSR